MKKTCLLIAGLTLAFAAFAADTKTSSAKPDLTPDQAEAKYTAVISERSQKIVDALGMADTNAAVKVHAIIMAQYRALNDWHNANDPKLKAAKGDKAVIAEIQAPLRKLHDEYLAGLARHLTPAQIETVKDKMTYGKVEFTYKGYLIEYPGLNDEQKAEVVRLLKEAREEAMDAGSADEKSAIFNRYKGKINNYLSKQGVQSEKARAKARAAAAATNSVKQP
jgi:hypothetical protein